jgi:hypothetical protein
LGNLKNGINDIKLHKWFKSINWVKLLNQEMEVPSNLNIRSVNLIAENFTTLQDLDYAQYQKEFSDI